MESQVINQRAAGETAVDTLPVDFDPHYALLKQRELDLLRARLALLKDHGLDFYRPHEKQHAFHSSTAKERGFFAGNRTGKSEAHAAETVAWFIGERSWYKYRFPIYGVREGKSVVVDFHDGHPHHPLVKQGIPQRATKQLIITTDWKKVDEVWTSEMGEPPGKMWKFIPANLKVETRRNHEGIVDRIYNPQTRAIIRFFTEQAFIKNNQSVESTDFDRVGVDEPIVEDMFKGLARGLVDRNGQADFTLTGLRERWIYDRFNPEDPKDAKAYRSVVNATMHDNPHLTEDAKQRYLDNLTEDERSCRELGIPLELSGLVYKEFKRDVHVLKPDSLPLGWTSWANPPLEWTIYVTIDVHDALPQAAFFVAVPPKGVPIVYDEIWHHCDAFQLADEINLRLLDRSIGFVKADPRAWIEDPVNKVSMAQAFASRGLIVEPASKALTFGINRMRELFRKRHIDPASGREVPELYFAPTLKRVFYEISRWHYDDKSKPVDKDDHMMECMYRLFINSPLAHIPKTVSAPIPDFTIPMSHRVIREFDHDMRAYEAAVGFRN